MAGEIVHIELPSSDFARSAAFYGKLFGWKTDGAQSGGHLLFAIPGGIGGSWIRDALAQAAGPVPFVAVTDVDKTLAEAERQGGRILVKRLSLANRGVFGLLADVDGNVIGVLSTKAGDVAHGSAGSESPASKKADAPRESNLGESKTVEVGAKKAPGKGAVKVAAKKPPGRKR
jgi:predicted enzyme related to lactoylglutathione lyase